jgi:hypothetical protein
MDCVKLFKWAAVVVVAAAAAFFVLPAAPAAADDDDDIYVAPLDEGGSDEALREEAGSGFDTPGSFYIDEDDYNAGSSEDGTWDPDVPEPEASEYNENGD